MRTRHAVALVALSVLVAGSCTNDFDQFDLTGGDATAGRGGSHSSGGSGASSGATASAAGSGGSNSIGTGGARTGGAAGAAGRAGSTGAGASQGGTAGRTTSAAGTGNAGNPAAGAAGESGAPGAAGGGACEGPVTDSVEHCGACDRACATTGVAVLACEAGVCSSSCSFGRANCSQPAEGADDGCETDALTDARHCGGCNNDCAAQGLGVCSDGSCGCASSEECGKGSGVACVAARCECDSVSCRPGERCRQAGPDRLCACNGGAACGPTQACCGATVGCVDLESSAEHCGACGHACVGGLACSAGACVCDSDADCDAGLPVAGGAGAGGEAGAATTGSRCVAGACVCGQSVCGAGERCRADGSCG
jgi:hypothetical protein